MGPGVARAVCVARAGRGLLVGLLLVGLRGVCRYCVWLYFWLRGAFLPGRVFSRGAFGQGRQVCLAGAKGKQHKAEKYFLHVFSCAAAACALAHNRLAAYDAL